MSSQSVVGQAWNGVGGAVHKFFSGLSPHGPGQPDAPPPPPDPGQATQSALQTQLSTEVQARRSSALVTGGEGLTEEPTTAGQMLLGGN